MEKEAFRFWMSQRTRDLNTGFAVYGVVTTLLLGILALSDMIDGSSSLRITFVIITIGLGIMTWLWIDGAIDDLGNGQKDMPGDEKDSALGKSFQKAPMMFFRVLIGIIMLATTGGLVFGAIVN